MAASSLSRMMPASHEIGEIERLILNNCDVTDGLVLDADRTAALLRRLAIIRKQMAQLEHEVATHRIMRDGAAAAAILGDLALDVLGDGVIAAGGATVIAPNFGRGRK